MRLKIAQGDQRPILGNERCRNQRLIHQIVGHLIGHDDGRESQRAKAVLQGCPADQHLVFKDLLQIAVARIDDQVLETHAGQLFGERNDTVDASVPFNGQGTGHFFGQLAEGFDIGRSRCIEQRLAVFEGHGSGPERLHPVRFENEAGTCSIGNFTGQGGKAIRLSRCVLHHKHLGSQLEPHPVILTGLETFQLAVHRSLILIGADHRRQPRRIDKGLLVPEQDGLTAHLNRIVSRSNGNRPNRWRRFRRELLLGLVRDVGALIQFSLATRQIHGKSQARGHPALTAVGFGKQLKDLNTRQAHMLLSLS